MTQISPDQIAANALRLLGPLPPNWVPELPGVDHDVLVVGGGHTGSTFAFALQRAGITRFSVIDAAADESQSGVWLTRARMNLLRTPKNLPGPELGVQGLGFQSWYEAQHGEQAFTNLLRIPRTEWAAYLTWYRRALGLKIRYATRLVRIEPADGHFRAHLEIAGVPHIETARKIILGNGVAGSGHPYFPEVLQPALPSGLLAHTAEAIDFAALKDRKIAVVGGAASAFDAAATALEAGAAEVHLFARRAELAALPVLRARGYPGAYDNYRHLPDAIRWQQAVRYRDAGSTAPIDAVERATKFPNFHLHLAAPWSSVRVQNGKLHASAAKGDFMYDFAIAGTGYKVDLAARPELADFASEIRLWRDQYTPPADLADAFYGQHPYLGFGHEFLEKTPGAAPFLNNIHVYNPGGFVSFGLPIGDVPSIRRDVPAVVAAISRDLLLQDLAHHQQRFNADVPPDFTAELYARSVWGRRTAEAAD